MALSHQAAIETWLIIEGAPWWMGELVCRFGCSAAWSLESRSGHSTHPMQVQNRAPRLCREKKTGRHWMVYVSISQEASGFHHFDGLCWHCHWLPVRRHCQGWNSWILVDPYHEWTCRCVHWWTALQHMEQGKKHWTCRLSWSESRSQPWSTMRAFVTATWWTPTSHAWHFLLGFAFEYLAALATRSGAGLLEHPKDPERPDYVSIWRLAILRMLLTLPNMRLVSVSQGLFGAPSPKPTTFLVLGLKTLETELHRHLLTGQLPSGTSIGKDDSGNYRTAPLKEYPPALCQAVATSMCTDLTSIECGDFGSPFDPPLDFIRRCEEMRDDSFDGWIGHDG